MSCIQTDQPRTIDHRPIAIMSKKRVLFVCLGNICRSPLAEAVFKHKVKAKGLDHLFEIDSCGTGNYHIGDPPDPRTVANAKRNGVVIEHLGRQLNDDDLAYFDVILAMDNKNLRSIQSLRSADEFSHKVKLMREFDSSEKGGEVPDPYYGEEKNFQEVFEILNRTADALLEELMSTK
jgi:protein-tyrosine phosphatase